MFEKVLVATDGSDTAKSAVRHASEIARMAGSKEVLIVHVCPACNVELDPDESNRQLAESILTDASEAFSGTGSAVRTLVEIDYPQESLGTAIVDIAQREKTDLIVLGSRGLSEFRGMMLGSVSSKVVQHAGCPVLIVKNHEG